MFDSGITAFELIEQVKKEADIAVPIPDESYIIWLNAIEQLLYTEIIKEQGAATYENTGEGQSLDALKIPEDENTVRFEDIHAVYANGVQLIRSTAASGVIFPSTYYKIGNKLCVNTRKGVQIKVVYFVRPKLKTTDNYDAVNVMLPHEFIDIVKAKLRAEAYKVANEGDIAAMWANDYNAMLENFKVWMSAKAPQFGV